MSIDLLNRARAHIVDMGQKVLSLLFGCTSRTAEYRFVFRHIPPPGSTVLDVGCCESLLPLKLARKGYNVYGIDTRQYLEKHPNLAFFQGDIICTPFPDKFFDCALAISTIEHIGLGLYRDPIHEDADTKAVQEISRILKPSGKLILTTPYAAKYKLARYAGGIERYYDSSTLKTLFCGFEVQDQEFFIGKSRFNWISVPEEQATRPDLKWHANIALVMVKKGF